MSATLGRDVVVLAESFASTPAGYVVGYGLPIVATVVGAMFVRYERAQNRTAARLDNLGDAMSANTQALALLVHQGTADRPTLARVPELSTSVAVLRDRMDRHEAWVRMEAATPLVPRRAGRPRPL